MHIHVLACGWSVAVYNIVSEICGGIKYFSALLKLLCAYNSPGDVGEIQVPIWYGRGGRLGVVLRATFLISLRGTVLLVH